MYVLESRFEEETQTAKNISQDRVEAYALNKIGDGGYTTEGTAKAMQWLSEASKATKDNPVVISETPSNTLVLYKE